MVILPVPLFNMQGRAATLTDVANEVLGLLGEDPITDIDAPDTKAGTKLKVHFYTSIDEVQGSFFWQELITIETIAADETDHYDNRKRYALPVNCLRPMGVRLRKEEGAELPPTTYTRLMEKSDELYDVEGNWLLTYAESVDILYIAREDDPTKWTSELLNTIVHCAAVNSGQSITDDPQIVSNLLQKYEQLVKPRAKQLQSKYKTNDRDLPRGFSYWKARRY